MVSGERISGRGAGELPGSTTFYQRLAGALNLPALVVHDVSHSTSGSAPMGGAAEGALPDVESLRAQLTGVRLGYDAAAVRLAGAVITGVPTAAYPSTAATLRSMLEQCGIYPAALLPQDDRMSRVTMAEVASALESRVLYGEHNLDAQVVRHVEVGTKQMPELVEMLEAQPGTLIVVSAARAEVLLSLLLVTQSKHVPLHPGIVLTGAIELPAVLRRMLSGLDVIGKPVLLTEKSSYEAAVALEQLRRASHPQRGGLAVDGAHSPVGSSRSRAAKLEAAEVLMERFLDRSFAAAMVQDNPAQDVSPIILKHTMFSAARRDKQHIVLPEGDDVRVVTAAAELLSRGLCDLTLLGKPEQIRSLAEKAHVDISAAALIDPQRVLLDEPTAWGDAMVGALCEARKAKGMTERKARELLRHDEAYFGTMMMMNGLADGMVSGACHSTANTMRPALQLIKMAPGYSLASSVFFMLLRDKVYVYGDCAINVDPSARDLAEIALASAGTARAFGITPRIAMLSYATGDSNQGPMIDKVREATERVRALAPDELVEGPIQFDAAVDPAVAAIKFKGVDSPVAGKATVCIFPDLNAGNNAYKAVQQASKASAVGPIMQGLRLPVNDLSRGCTVDDIVNTVVCTALQSIAAKEKQ